MIRQDTCTNKGSVCDTIHLVTGAGRHAPLIWSLLKLARKDLAGQARDHRFDGDVAPTPVAAPATLVEIAYHVAQSDRPAAARALCKVLNVHEGLVAVVEARQQENPGLIEADRVLTIVEGAMVRIRSLEARIQTEQIYMDDVLRTNDRLNRENEGLRRLLSLSGGRPPAPVPAVPE